MILFIAPNPFKVDEREGYLQRVAAIDAIFDKEKKNYSSDCSSHDELAELIVKADLIYVHSIYRAEEIIDCYPIYGSKIITDLHGVVPEEELFTGETRRSDELTHVEKVVFQYGAAFVSVTDAMVTHYQNKYPDSLSAKWVTLPIFDDTSTETYMDKDLADIAIYAGGAQKWQNTDLIVSAINDKGNEFSYIILTHDQTAFSAIEDSRKNRVTIKSVPSHEVSQYYRQAKYGFILRDDTTVNSVACPTKLIEYLSNGVVPIVKSPKIGDFEKFEYKYISYEDFISGHFEKSKFDEYVENNLGVIDQLKEQAQEGKKQLLELSDEIISSVTKLSVNDVQSLVASACSNALKTRELNAAKYQIEEQVRIIGEYGKSVNYYKDKVGIFEAQNDLKLLRQVSIFELLKRITRGDIKIHSGYNKKR